MGKMENMICLDSDFLIDVLRNKEESKKWLEENKDKILCTTIINIFELFYGAYKSNRKKEIDSCNELLDDLPILELSINAAKRSANVAADLDKTGKPIGFRDVFIAGIVLTENISLKTNNKKHFENIEDLQIIS